MPAEADLLGEFEVHSPDGIRRVLAAGVSPTKLINGKRPIDILIEPGFLRICSDCRVSPRAPFR